MLAIALELANPIYEDMASKFFEHFISIADAINHFDGTGLWDEDDGFYYDHLRVDGSRQVSRTRSMVASSQWLPSRCLRTLTSKRRASESASSGF